MWKKVGEVGGSQDFMCSAVPVLTNDSENRPAAHAPTSPLRGR